MTTTQQIEKQIIRLGFDHNQGGPVDSVVIEETLGGVRIYDYSESAVCDPEQLLAALAQLEPGDWDGLWQAVNECEISDEIIAARANDELINRAHAAGIGASLVEANVLQERGSNIWVVWTATGVTVEVLGPAESVREWGPDVIMAAHWGRAKGWDEQDSSWWFDGLCHRNDEGIYVHDDTGSVIGDGTERDAALLAVETGDYPELIDNAISRLREAMNEE